MLANCSRSAWSDFLTPVGQSDQWVSAYVADALPEDSEILRGVVDRLIRRQRYGGGLSYNARAPADADSTAAALTLFSSRKAFVPGQNCRRAVNFLLRHVQADGGFATYRATLRLRFLMKAYGVSYKGWTQSHTCVTAACLNALLHAGFEAAHSVIIRGLEFLRSAMDRSTGLWSAYWWQGPFYATASAIRVFRRSGQTPPAGLRLKFLLENQSTSGAWRINTEDSAFATALALVILNDQSGNDVNESRRRALDWLLAEQQTDGSWTSVPILRIPHPFEKKPEDDMPWRIDGLGTGVLIRDRNRLYTTATVLKALTEI